MLKYYVQRASKCIFNVCGINRLLWVFLLSVTGINFIKSSYKFQAFLGNVRAFVVVPHPPARGADSSR